MEPDKKNTPATEGQSSKDDGQAPADALSRTPEELEEEQAAQALKNADSGASDDPNEKKVSPIKRFFRKVNIYFLFFMLIIVIAGVIAAVNYLNSQKVEPEPTISSQKLTEDTLKQLANTDATVGNTSQTLTIQGNAIIAGQTLTRGNLNVAGNIQSGGSIQGPTLTISGTSNLGTAQINSLQVAQNTAIQGNTTMRDLSVSGTSTLSGPVTAAQLTVSRLILSGNAVLQVPNHVSFTGPAPGRGAIGPALGSGGTSSVSGSDTSGTVNISTGGNPAVGCFVRVNFAQAFAAQPRVIISPVGAAAGQTEYYVDRNTAGFSICTSAPAPANQTFAFDFFVAG
ncbi:hypothetical protein HY312_00495 [Candidatus Saccharibacteria bacterium]|nr:hypothetical protein [Candidatus Saccharibacteria bacterium]